MFNRRRYSKIHDLDPQPGLCAWCGGPLPKNPLPIRRYKSISACCVVCQCSANVLLDYNLLRNHVWERDQGRCNSCGRSLSLTRSQEAESGPSYSPVHKPVMHLHHKLPLRGAREPVEAILRRSPGNCIPLCPDCHRRAHRGSITEVSCAV